MRAALAANLDATSRRLRSQSENDLATNPPAKPIFEALEGLRRNPLLRPLTARHLPQIDLSTDGDQCDDPACTSYATYTITVPPAHLHEWPAAPGPAIILGHEIGHFVVDLTLSKSQRKSLSPLAYHVLVDAVGVVLAEQSIASLVATLRATRGGGEGDVDQRLDCWTRPH